MDKLLGIITYKQDNVLFCYTTIHKCLNTVHILQTGYYTVVLYCIIGEGV